jgi:hypothetical protein
LVQERARQFDAGIRRRRTQPFHSGQGFAARAAQQAQEEKFHLVVGMMGQRDLLNPPRARCSRQKFMTQLSRGHFQRQFIFARENSHIPASGHEVQTQFLRRPLCQPRIRIAAAPAQLMIEVGHDKPPFVGTGEALEQMQQYHRIHPTGNRDDNRRPAIEKAPRQDGLFHLPPQTARAQGGHSLQDFSTSFGHVGNPNKIRAKGVNLNLAVE